MSMQGQDVNLDEQGISEAYQFKNRLMHVSLSALSDKHKGSLLLAIERTPFPSWHDILQGIAHQGPPSIFL